MSTPPQFFLPATSRIDHEAAFAHIAKGLNRPVPAVGERVYWVIFESDGTLWKATVGERLQGRKPRMLKGKNGGGWEDWWFDDPALVLAIFPPVPYFVVVLPDINSHFRDRAFAATPIGFELFSHSSR